MLQFLNKSREDGLGLSTPWEVGTRAPWESCGWILECYAPWRGLHGSKVGVEVAISIHVCLRLITVLKFCEAEIDSAKQNKILRSRINGGSVARRLITHGSTTCTFSLLHFHACVYFLVFRSYYIVWYCGTLSNIGNIKTYM